MSTKRTTCVLVCTHTTEQLLDKFCACFVNVLKKIFIFGNFYKKVPSCRKILHMRMNSSLTVCQINISNGILQINNNEPYWCYLLADSSNASSPQMTNKSCLSFHFTNVVVC